MELYARVVNSWKSLTFFARTTIFGVWQGSEYASDIHENKLHNNTLFSTPSGHLLLSLPDAIFPVNYSPWFILILLGLFNQCHCTILWIKAETFYVCHLKHVLTWEKLEIFAIFVIEIYNVCRSKISCLPQWLVRKTRVC